MGTGLSADATAASASTRVAIGLVGGGKGGCALLDVLLESPFARVVVVVDQSAEAPGLARARALGIPTGSHPLDVFAHPVGLVLEVTGRPEVFEELLRRRPPGVEVIGSASVRFFWDLLQALREAQASLVRVERLRAFGQLASGIVHDFNNLLGAILGRTQLLLRQELLAPDLVRQFKAIEQAALDASRRVFLIQEFTRARSPKPPGLVDLGRLLEDVREFARPRWENEAEAHGIIYTVRLEAEPVPPITGDPTELWEAFTNVLLNALEAMPHGGQVWLAVGRDGERARVTVQDDGPGMPEEIRRRAWDPFFTTKGTGGSGFGLSIVREIIERHGGQLLLESREGQGTTVTAWFPVPAERAEAPAVVPTLWSPRRANILVIDDEPEVRTILRDLLEAQGHTVVEAADGPTGLALCEAERFDLVLLDLAMPRMSGWEVATILERRGRPPVGLITGWAEQMDAAQLARHRVAFVLGKPFELHEVLRCVAVALAAGPPGD